MVAEEKYFKVIEINGQSMSVIDAPYKSWYETGELVKTGTKKTLVKKKRGSDEFEKK